MFLMAIIVLLIKTSLTRKLSKISKIISVLPLRIVVYVEHGDGGSNDYRFTITEISYLVLDLFHDLVQTPRNDMCDPKFLGCTNRPWSQKRQKWVVPPSKVLHPITRPA